MNNRTTNDNNQRAMNNDTMNNRTTTNQRAMNNDNQRTQTLAQELSRAAARKIGNLAEAETFVAEVAKIVDLYGLDTPDDLLDTYTYVKRGLDARECERPIVNLVAGFYGAVFLFYDDKNDNPKGCTFSLYARPNVAMCVEVMFSTVIDCLRELAFDAYLEQGATGSREQFERDFFTRAAWAIDDRIYGARDSYAPGLSAVMREVTGDAIVAYRNDEGDHPDAVRIGDAAWLGRSANQRTTNADTTAKPTTMNIHKLVRPTTLVFATSGESTDNALTLKDGVPQRTFHVFLNRAAFERAQNDMWVKSGGKYNLVETTAKTFAGYNEDTILVDSQTGAAIEFDALGVALGYDSLPALDEAHGLNVKTGRTYEARQAATELIDAAYESYVS